MFVRGVLWERRRGEGAGHVHSIGIESEAYAVA